MIIREPNVAAIEKLNKIEIKIFTFLGWYQGRLEWITVWNLTFQTLKRLFGNQIWRTENPKIIKILIIKIKIKILGSFRGR